MSRRFRIRTLMALTGTVCSLSGCYLSHERAPAPPPEVDAGCIPVPTIDSGVVPAESVDLLIMVDNSNSMAEEQESLARELPNIVRAITSGDVDLDGRQDFTPVGSLQVGVISSDMGTGGFRVPTCAEPGFGEDGIFRTVGSSGPDCEAMYPPFLTFEPAAAITPEEFARDVGCVTRLGTGG